MKSSTTWAVALVALAQLWLYRNIFSGGILFGSDNLLTGVTVRSFARQFFLEFGRLPYWNPYLCGGVPYLGNFVAVGFYPLNLLLMPLPPHLAMNLIPLVHGFLGALFTFFFLRLEFRHLDVALVGALLYLVGGAHVMRLYAGHYDAIAVVSWGVAVVLAWALFERSGKARYPVAATLALAMQIVAGYPQYVLLTHAVILPWIAGVLYRCRGRLSPSALIFWPTLYLLGGLGLSALQWIPALTMLQDSVRHGALDWVYLTNYSMPPRQLLSLFLPHLFGDGLTQHFHGVPFIWETSAYFGLAALPLVLHNDWRLRRNRWMLGIAIVLMLLALGSYCEPVYRLYLQLMPLQKVFRVPARFLLPLSWLYLFWVASGFSRWHDRGAEATSHWRHWRLWVLAAAMLLCFLSVHQAWREWLIGQRLVQPLATWNLWLSGLCLIGVVLAMRLPKSHGRPWLIVVLVLIDLTAAHARYFRTESLARFYPPPFDFGRWRVHSQDRHYKMITQAPMHRYFHLAGREAMITPRFNDYLNTMVGLPLASNQDNFQLAGFDPMMSLASVRWLVSDQPMSGVEPLPYVGKFGDFRIHENTKAFPRAFFVDHLSVADDHHQILAQMRQDVDRFADTAFVEQPLELAGLIRVSREPQLLHWQADVSRWRLPHVNAPQFLVLTDTFARGWQAQIDGKPARLLITNAFMQGVVVPANSHELTLSYTPPGLELGQGVSAVSLAALLLIILRAYQPGGHVRRRPAKM